MTALSGIVFDTDGVLLATAVRHAAAWKEAFDAAREYRELVDGRCRLDGVRAFLAARRISLPPGTPEDPPGCSTVCAVAARKDQIFTGLVRSEGVDVFGDVRPVLRRLRDMGLGRAAVSASRHARALLEAADLVALFDVVVDGRDAATLALPGKPAPALLLEAAHRLGAAPGRAAVVEDALVGVEAGRHGVFRLVVGLDRDRDPRTEHALRAHGADLVRLARPAHRRDRWIG